MDTFPLFIDRPEAILVHGYIEPGVPLDEQRPQVLAGTMGGDNYLRAQYDRPWYELWDGEKPVLVGHLDYLRSGEPFVYRDRVFGLDTGCVTGGRLTGLILPDFRFVSVASRKDHWHAIRQSYRLEKAARANRLSYKRSEYNLPWDFEAERVLEEIIAHVLEENERTLSQLKKDPEYDLLSSRQRAKKYQALVKRSPVKALLHLARLGEMSKTNARRVLKDADRAAAILEAIRPFDRVA
jgi:serine/threonine protein phosphatase 1